MNFKILLSIEGDTKVENTKSAALFEQYPEKIDAKIAPTNMTNERITPLLNPITVKIANIAKTHISSVSEFIGLPPKTQSHSKNIP